jgi:branched-chain amino acid transport system substrate-binding protein
MTKTKGLKWCLFFILIVSLCLISFNGIMAAERTEIRVGAPASITGLNAMTGKEHRWGYEQSVKDINAKGGVFVKDLGKKLPIKLIWADDKSQNDGGAQAMERLIKRDKIDLGLSSNITPINIAAGTVAEKYKVYYQIVVSWIDFIEKENFKWVADLFSDTGRAAQGPFAIWDEQLPPEKRPKRVALLMEDNQDGQGFGMGFKAWAKKYGYKIAIDAPFEPGTKDFSSHILKYKAAKVDAILTLIPPTDGITLLRQMKEQNLKVPYIHGWKGFWTREFEKAMGGDADYIIHDGFWSDKMGAPGAKRLQQQFIKAFGYDSTSVGLSYANPQILAMAIERAGSFESAKVRDEVFGGEFKGTMMGDVKYNEKGLAFTPFLALQWWKGERMPVYPYKPDVWNLKMRPR